MGRLEAKYMRLEAKYIFSEAMYMRLEAKYIFSEAMYMCLEVKYIFSEAMYMRLEVKYIFQKRNIDCGKACFGRKCVFLCGNGLFLLE